MIIWLLQLASWHDCLEVHLKCIVFWALWCCNEMNVQKYWKHWFCSGDVGVGLNVRRMRSQFLSTFNTTYCLRPIADIGSVFRKYPGQYQVHLSVFPYSYLSIFTIFKKMLPKFGDSLWSSKIIYQWWWLLTANWSNRWKTSDPIQLLFLRFCLHNQYHTHMQHSAKQASFLKFSDYKRMLCCLIQLINYVRQENKRTQQRPTLRSLLGLWCQGAHVFFLIAILIRNFILGHWHHRYIHILRYTYSYRRNVCQCRYLLKSKTNLAGLCLQPNNLLVPQVIFKFLCCNNLTIVALDVSMSSYIYFNAPWFNSFLQWILSCVLHITDFL